MKRVWVLFGLVGYLVAANVAQADVTFQYVTDASSYSGASGTPATVNIYLQETDTGGQTLFGNSSIKGLQSYGVLVYQTSSTGSSTITSISTNSAAGLNGFGSSQSVPVNTATANSSSTGSLAAALGTSNAIDYFNSVAAGTTTNGSGGAALVSGTAGNGVYKILVASLSVQVGTSTTFTLTSMFNSPGDNANAQGSDVTLTLPAGANAVTLDENTSYQDATINGAQFLSQAFTVGTSVSTPEPSSMALCGLAVCGIGYGAWRRRKAKLQAEVAAPGTTAAA